MKNFTRNTLLSVASLGLVAGISMSAAAQQYDETYVNASSVGAQTIRIEFTAADLATDQGLASLHSRIKLAAKQVCGPTSLRDAGGLRESSRNRECYNQAVEAGFSQLDADQLAAIGH